MASNFPTSLDSFTDPTSGSSLASPSHSGQHIDLNDAVEKIETKLGIGSSPASSAVNGAVLTANGSGTTTWAKLGVVGYVQRTSNFTATTTLADITSMTLTFTAVANRLYRISYSWPSVLVSAVNNRLTIAVTDASNTIIDQAYEYFATASADISYSRSSLHTFTAGSQTCKLRAQIDIGAGTGTLYSDVTRRGWFLIEDIGPA